MYATFNIFSILNVFSYWEIVHNLYWLTKVNFSTRQGIITKYKLLLRKHNILAESWIVF